MANDGISTVDDFPHHLFEPTRFRKPRRRDFLDSESLNLIRATETADAFELRLQAFSSDPNDGRRLRREKYNEVLGVATNLPLVCLEGYARYFGEYPEHKKDAQMLDLYHQYRQKKGSGKQKTVYLDPTALIELSVSLASKDNGYSLREPLSKLGVELLPPLSELKEKLVAVDDWGRLPIITDDGWRRLSALIKSLGEQMTDVLNAEGLALYTMMNATYLAVGYTMGENLPKRTAAEELHPDNAVCAALRYLLLVAPELGYGPKFIEAFRNEVSTALSHFGESL